MTTRRGPAVLLAAAAALAAGCATTGKRYDPFKVPREQFYGSLKVVALAPVQAPSDLENADPIKARFAATIAARLREAGLQVVGPEEIGPILEEVRKAHPGVFDPQTGKLDQEKAKAREKEELQRIREKHPQVDALLQAGIRVVQASLVRDVASWDGVTESAGTSGWKSFWVTHSGRIPALSLIVWLTRADGTDLYANAGGLRVIARVDAGGKPVSIPHADLFADEQRNGQAVSLALGPLLSPKAEPKE